MNDHSWSYILNDKAVYDPAETDIPLEALDQLRSQFQFWYPLDVLFTNAEAMTAKVIPELFGHVAIWPCTSDNWPRTVMVHGTLTRDARSVFIYFVIRYDQTRETDATSTCSEQQKQCSTLGGHT